MIITDDHATGPTREDAPESRNRPRARRRSRTWTAGDILRIPIGLLFIYISVEIVRKFTTWLSRGPVGIAVFVLAVVVGCVFTAVGLTMALGPLVPARRRPKRPTRRPKDRT